MSGGKPCAARDRDTRLWGTGVRDTPKAGLTPSIFMHLARIIKAFN